MSCEVSVQELQSVLSMDARRRYEYFLNKVADWEEVWSIRNHESWGLMADSSGRALVPVWPAAAYARVCCGGEWSGFSPEKIDLTTWLSNWIPGIAGDGQNVAVFPLPDDTGLSVDAILLAEDLARAIDCYE